MKSRSNEQVQRTRASARGADFYRTKMTTVFKQTILLVLVMVGCSQQPSGVFELVFTAPGPSATPNEQAGYRMFAEKTRKTHRIIIDGNHLDLRLGEQCHLSGTFTVSSTLSGRKLFLSAERMESKPLGVAITNAATRSRSGRKFAHEMFMPDGDTIQFMGLTFRRSKE